MATATSPRIKHRHRESNPALWNETPASSPADSGGIRGKRRSRTLERYLAIPVFGTGCSPHCGAFLGGRAGTRTLNGLWAATRLASELLVWPVPFHGLLTTSRTWLPAFAGPTAGPLLRR